MSSMEQVALVDKWKERCLDRVNRQSFMNSYHTLLLESNHRLGEALMTHGFISEVQFKLAIEKLEDALSTGDEQSANLLQILLYDIKAFEEHRLIDLLVEDMQVGLVDLSNYQTVRFTDFDIGLHLCRITSTVPYEHTEDFVALATAFYLSEPVRAFWSKLFPERHVLWYATSFSSVSHYLDRFVPPGEDE